ncbi:hypothetical protein DPEC_G00331670 [Dallia pectoralis]|uniref:Uncharacterized protein n=1 Tax=Dallia pectoralis TaxID=75939 RepID=A0ACC2F613_DALPE|nr:hypothetical protein DPEC_G00331670 [Dallia pectoralis]
MGTETCPHILGQCPGVRDSRIKRHHKLCDLLAEEAESASWSVTMEMVCRTPSGVLRSPNLVFVKVSLAFVLDVTVRFEVAQDTLQLAASEKVARYKPVLPYVLRETGASSARVFGFPLGGRGKWHPANETLLKRLGDWPRRRTSHPPDIERRVKCRRTLQRPLDEDPPAMCRSMEVTKRRGKYTKGPEPGLPPPGLAKGAQRIWEVPCCTSRPGRALGKLERNKTSIDPLRLSEKLEGAGERGCPPSSVNILCGVNVGSARPSGGRSFLLRSTRCLRVDQGVMMLQGPSARVQTPWQLEAGRVSVKSWPSPEGFCHCIQDWTRCYGRDAGGIKIDVLSQVREVSGDVRPPEGGGVGRAEAVEDSRALSRQAGHRRARELFEKDRSKLAEILFDGAGGGRHRARLLRLVSAFKSRWDVADPYLGLGQFSSDHGADNAVFHKPILPEEVKSGLGSIKSGSAAGPDGLSKKALKTWDPTGVELAEMYSV